MREKELIVYRDFEDGELLYDMAFLMSHYDDEYYNTRKIWRHSFTSAFMI